MIPHPFGILSRDEVRVLASVCVDDVARLLCTPAAAGTQPSGIQAPGRLELIEALDDPMELNQLFMRNRWSDGLPIVPPTPERVEAMLRGSSLARDAVVASVAPAFRAATPERIAVNAVMAGCHPEYLPVLIAATKAVATPRFNLSGVQSTTNPAAVGLVINGPIAQRLGVNGAGNCLGPGHWANAALGRALRLVLQNIGGALPGDMDKATQGQPGKYTFCCAENEAASPWEPLHVERGYARETSTVTVLAPLGTWSMNTHAKDAADLIRVIGDTMAFPCSSDYVHGGAPWLVLSPEHAHVLKRDGLTKRDVKQRLWEASKLAAARLAAKDLGRVQSARRAELGEITPATMLPISLRPEDISLLVAGGDGTHSVYLPISGHSRSVTGEICA
ncbi:MAG: hypothetical protein EHM59_11725 [Betaproteobacteria bacterium]|nr:MAG: hypothetical protein EHM59_11725 [Betaproteobacteria bacterium]